MSGCQQPPLRAKSIGYFLWRANMSTGECRRVRIKKQKPPRDKSIVRPICRPYSVDADCIVYMMSTVITCTF